MSNNPADLLVILLVVGVLVLIMRWVFAPSRKGSRITQRPVDASSSSDLGLLQVVVSGVTRSEAMALRARLGDPGIRSSMSGRADGGFDVLVFHADVAAAQAVLNVY